MRWPFSKPAEQNVPKIIADLSIKALPLAVNITDQNKIDHARYRLDAIARHVEQVAELSEQKFEEFVSEARVHVANLLHAKAITESEASGFLARIGVRKL